MAIRLNPPLGDTKELLTAIMVQIVEHENQRVAFCVPAGQGNRYLARIRTMVSRKRRELESRGHKPKRFTLHSTVHPETHNGVRYDCIVLWHTVKDSHRHMEILEDLLSNG